MGTLVKAKLEKISQEEVNFKGQLTDALFKKIAQTMNAFCVFKDIACTELTGSGTYTTKSNASSLIIISVSGAGGGGGGGTGSVLTYGGILSGSDTAYYTRRQFGTDGYDGSDGGSSMFNGQLISPGGAGGKGGSTYILSTNGYPGASTRIYSSDETYSDFQKMRDSIKCMQRNGYTIAGVNAGKGGAGAEGTRSETTNTSPFGTTDTARGTNGYCGQSGRLGSVCIDVEPGITYTYDCGAGGSGGASGDTYTSNGITMSNPNVGEDGDPGAMIIYEVGF